MKPALYLIPGSLDLVRLYTKWVKVFTANGYKVHVAPVGLEIHSIEKMAQKVRDDILQKNLENVIVISASLGGLIAKHCVAVYPEVRKRVKKIIAVCSPFSGSWLAVFGFMIPAYRQIIQGSSFLKKLASHSDVNELVVSIRPRLDTEVFPLKSEVLEGAKNIQVQVIGHVFAPYRKKTIKIIESELNIVETN